MFRKHKLICLFCFSFILAGCSSTPKIEYVEIPDFKTVAIVKTENLPSIEKLRDAQERTADAAGVGAASGGVAGMATGVLLCGTTGPLVGLCISGIGLIGALSGGAGGLIYGLGTAAEGKYADRINANLGKVEEKYVLQQEMLSRLTSQVPANFILPPAQADIIVSPVLSGVNVEQPDEDHMYLLITGYLVFSWQQDGGEEYFGKAEFDYKSPTALIVKWNGNYGKMYEDAILGGMDDLVLQMNHRLTARINRGAQSIEVKGAESPQ